MNSKKNISVESEDELNSLIENRLKYEKKIEKEFEERFFDENEINIFINKIEEEYDYEIESEHEVECFEMHHNSLIFLENDNCQNSSLLKDYSSPDYIGDTDSYGSYPEDFFKGGFYPTPEHDDNLKRDMIKFETYTEIDNLVEYNGIEYETDLKIDNLIENRIKYEERLIESFDDHFSDISEDDAFINEKLDDYVENYLDSSFLENNNKAMKNLIL